MYAYYARHTQQLAGESLNKKNLVTSTIESQLKRFFFATTTTSWISYTFCFNVKHTVKRDKQGRQIEIFSSRKIISGWHTSNFIFSRKTRKKTERKVNGVCAVVAKRTTSTFMKKKRLEKINSQMMMDYMLWCGELTLLSRYRCCIKYIRTMLAALLPTHNRRPTVYDDPWNTSALKNTLISCDYVRFFISSHSVLVPCIQNATHHRAWKS